jgi:hypothetical protein
LDVKFVQRRDHFQLEPSIVHESIELDNGHFAVRIPAIGPKEVITVGVLAYQNLPQPLTIKTDDGLAKSIPVQLQCAAPQWMIYLLLLLTLVGPGTVVYWCIVAAVRVYSCATGYAI